MEIRYQYDFNYWWRLTVYIASTEVVQKVLEMWRTHTGMGHVGIVKYALQHTGVLEQVKECQL